MVVRANSRARQRTPKEGKGKPPPFIPEYIFLSIPRSFSSEAVVKIFPDFDPYQSD
jgi:hypothetical protein